MATREWIGWFNHRRRYEYCGDWPPPSARACTTVAIELRNPLSSQISRAPDSPGGFARTPVTLLITDLDVRILDATTGELLRELTIDPTRDYQPTGKDRHARWHQNQKQADP